jgi:hypothetical protein
MTQQDFDNEKILIKSTPKKVVTKLRNVKESDPLYKEYLFFRQVVDHGSGHTGTLK